MNRMISLMIVFLFTNCIDALPPVQNFEELGNNRSNFYLSKEIGWKCLLCSMIP